MTTHAWAQHLCQKYPITYVDALKQVRVITTLVDTYLETEATKGVDPGAGLFLVTSALEKKLSA